MKRIITAFIICAMAAALLCSCGDDTTVITPSENETSSVVASTSSKTVNVASVEPKTDLPWPDAEALAVLPKLCDTVDYYVDAQAGGSEGTYNIQVKDIEYSEFKEYIDNMLENGFSHWETIGEMVLPDELSDGDSAFCPLTNGESLWGIIEYNPSGNAEGNKVAMVFYDYNPYSGY